MPEGHTIHRAARLQRALLRGQPVVADSPQGRFTGGAAVLDGRRLRTVNAHGKHLFYRWAPDVTLHVHLGLFGRFRTHRREGAEEPLPPTTAGTRLRLVTADAVLQLAGPTACELVDPPAEAALLARLGPDPLRRDADPERTWAALQRRTIAIGAALLDQRVLSGIGNVYRAEALFVAGLAPQRPARALARDEFDLLWAVVVAMLRAGEKTGRIVTVEPAEVGARSRSRIPRRDAVYVYHRVGRPCRRCGTTIRAEVMVAREISWCPRCQPR